MSKKIHRWATAALCLAGTLGTGMAQAREAELQWSLTIGTPPFVQAPRPYVRVQPHPSYSRPAPFYAPLAARPADRGWTRPTRWDRDGDGIPNRYDRLYNPAWDRDGDGIPNRRDHFDDRRQDPRGDGIPSRRHGDGGPGGRGR